MSMDPSRKEARRPYKLHGLKFISRLSLYLLLDTMQIFQLVYKSLDYAFIHFNQFMLDTLAQGPIPRHVAFILDGNRRYAKVNDIYIAEGYLAGVKTLVKVEYNTRYSKAINY